jgi:muramoyltetrapeptide carboxypeptidase
VDDLHGLFADNSIKAIFCARGGYGSSELLPHIDYGLIRRHPKIFIGYSDVTVLHQAFRKHAGLGTFHGPMPVASKFTKFTQTSFRSAVFSAQPLGELKNPDPANALRPDYPVRTIVSGHGEGPIVGGNMSMIVGLLGTPYEIDTRGAIIFIEDVDEEPYRIGRMLIQLKQAGKFDAVRGVVVGKCKECGPKDYKPSTVSPYTLGEHIDNVLNTLTVPVVYGFALGHTDDQITLPLGARASLLADESHQRLTILESGVT